MAIKETIRKFINPIFLTHIRLKNSFIKIVEPIVFDGINCLDVGCGDRPYEYLFKKGSYIGIDIEDSGRSLDLKKPDHFYDGETFPFEDESFDMVISTQVLEHVPNPQLILNEMARVCKTGGCIVISLPFVYPEHEEPFDYFRFTQFGIAELLKKAGLKIQSISKDTSALETMATILCVYIIYNIIPKNKIISYIFTLFLLIPIQLFSMLLSKILPDNGQFYLNNIVHARKK